MTRGLSAMVLELASPAMRAPLSVLMAGVITVVLFAVFSHHSHHQAHTFVMRRSQTDVIDFHRDVAQAKFLIVGDWGVGSSEQMQVAKQLALTAELWEASFVVSTGDQVYDAGVSSVDDPLFYKRFENVYTAQSLAVPWFMILGNHDCRGNIPALVQYSDRSSKWTMPNRYYAVRHSYNGFRALFVHVDACMLVCAKGTNYRCDPSESVNVGTESQYLHQLSWLEQELSQSADWKFVVGHWPLYSFLGNGPTAELILDIQPLLQKYGVHAYIHGHDHSLQHNVLNGAEFPQFIGSGAGGYRLHPVLKPEADASLNHGVTNKYASATFGFVAANLTRTTMELTFLDTAGKVLYSTALKNGLS